MTLSTQTIALKEAVADSKTAIMHLSQTLDAQKKTLAGATMHVTAPFSYAMTFAYWYGSSSMLLKLLLAVGFLSPPLLVSGILFSYLLLSLPLLILVTAFTLTSYTLVTLLLTNQYEAEKRLLKQIDRLNEGLEQTLKLAQAFEELVEKLVQHHADNTVKLQGTIQQLEQEIELLVQETVRLAQIGVLLTTSSEKLALQTEDMKKIDEALKETLQQAQTKLKTENLTLNQTINQLAAMNGALEKFHTQFTALQSPLTLFTQQVKSLVASFKPSQEGEGIASTLINQAANQDETALLTSCDALIVEAQTLRQQSPAIKPSAEKKPIIETIASGEVKKNTSLQYLIRP